MADRNSKRTEEANVKTFAVDAKYLRTQAKEAFTTFVAPLSGVYDAARGPAPAVVRPSNAKHKQPA